MERVADTIAIMKKSKILLVEPLETLKTRSSSLTITFDQEIVSWQGEPFFQQIVEEKIDGRELWMLGHDLSEDAERTLKEQVNVARYDIRTPSLEEIFVSYMK